MKVSNFWLKELINLQTPFEEVEKLLPLRTIGTKEITPDFVELDMKGYNRADLLSLRGVATEIGAITNSKTSFEEKSVEQIIKMWENLPKAKVEVQSPQLSPLYCIAKIEGLKVAPSPENWVKKLNSSGVRSINNIADITNLVMIEYGQPMHAFDASQVSNETIIVRTAKPGEKLTTLDNKERLLEVSDILITDPEKPLGLAGVMGGKNSEISDETTTILLEAAIFDPITLRQTSQRLNLPSEASKRFQHGLTKKRLIQALEAAIKYYQDLGGKLVAITLSGDLTDPTKTISLSKDKLNSLVGIEFDSQFIEESLLKLHFQLQKVSDKEWQITPPYFRLDVDIEADVIEEIARMYGYETIPAKPLLDSNLSQLNQDHFNVLRDLRHKLVSKGFTEIQTYSFYSTDVINNLLLPNSNLVKVLNPMSKETEYLRDTLWTNLLEKISLNIRKNSLESLALFEIGKIYHYQDDGNPQENWKLALALSGDSGEVVNQLLSLLEPLHLHLEQQVLVDNTNLLFNPQAFGVVKDNDNKEVGILAEIHPQITDKFGIEERVSVLEISLDNLT